MNAPAEAQDTGALVLGLADRAVEDHRATLEIVRAAISACLGRERGMTFDELYDLDRTLVAASEHLTERLQGCYAARRKALSGVPHTPPRGPHLHLVD